VPPGAIAFHLHSFSAKTVRSPRKAWLGAFVRQGYCAMVGNVFEPYLEYTHRPQDLLKYLLEGHSFGDAAMWSYPCLSWQGVALGDPLYRPFKVSLAEQLASESKGPFAGYAAIREANRIQAEDGNETAITYLRKAFLDQPSLALSFKLAELYAKTGEKQKALNSLKFVQYLSVLAPDERVLVKRIADLLEILDEKQGAYELYSQLLGEAELDKSLKINLLEDGVGIAGNAGETITETAWSIELQKLKSPAPK